METKAPVFEHLAFVEAAEKEAAEALRQTSAAREFFNMITGSTDAFPVSGKQLETLENYRAYLKNKAKYLRN